MAAKLSSSKARAAVALVAGAGFLVACTTTDPYTGEQRTSRTLKGAGIGALGGAAIGALTGIGGGAGRNALIGAGIGVLAGGAVGAYQDRQEAQLRQRLAQTGVGVRRVGDDIMLIMPGDITFDTGRSDVTSNFYPVLDDVALVLNEFESTYVEVLGHTDRVGSAPSNQTLSEARASSVASYLRSRQVVPQRLIIQGFGENAPLVPTADGVAEAANRRVEIRLSPLT